MTHIVSLVQLRGARSCARVCRCVTSAVHVKIYIQESASPLDTTNQTPQVSHSGCTRHPALPASSGVGFVSTFERRMIDSNPDSAEYATHYSVLETFDTPPPPLFLRGPGVRRSVLLRFAGSGDSSSSTACGNGLLVMCVGNHCFWNTAVVCT